MEGADLRAVGDKVSDDAFDEPRRVSRQVEVAVRRLTSLGSELLARGLATSGLAGGLLSASHC